MELARILTAYTPVVPWSPEMGPSPSFPPVEETSCPETLLLFLSFYTVNTPVCSEQKIETSVFVETCRGEVKRSGSSEFPEVPRS